MTNKAQAAAPDTQTFLPRVTPISVNPASAIPTAVLGLTACWSGISEVNAGKSSHHPTTRTTNPTATADQPTA